MKNILLALAGAGLLAQAQPKFEVVSIKQNTGENARGTMGMKSQPGGRVSIKNYPLQILISEAYDLPFQSPRLTGGPDWIRAERYDIEATAPEGVIPENATTRQRDAIVRKMLQSLLAERFKLVLHIETKEQPIYAVVIGKKGVKLQQSAMEEKNCAADCHHFQGGQGRGLHSAAATLEDAARFVSNWSDRPIVDETGIATLFKFDTPGWVPMRVTTATGAPSSPEGLDDPLRPSLFAIFEQMGLKLEPRKGPIETYRIESIARPEE